MADKGPYRPSYDFSDFPGGSDGKIVYLQWGRPGFDSWVRKIPWRRKWQPTPVLLPGKSHGWRSLVGYSPLGHKESDMTEWLHFLSTHGFFSSHVQMWELDHKESWAPKNWCFWTVGLEKTLESPLECKEIKPVNLKGNQSWIFTGRTDAEALILWPSDAKSQFFGKDPEAGKDWRQEEKGVTEDEMVRGHHRLSGHEFEQALGDSEGQGSLAFSCLRNCRVGHQLMTE